MSLWVLDYSVYFEMVVNESSFSSPLNVITWQSKKLTILLSVLKFVGICEGMYVCI